MTSLDQGAGYAFRDGNYRLAAQLIAEARIQQPERGEHWDKRDAQIREAKERQQPENLADQTNRRMEAAGITADDPELQFWHEWNRAVYDREAGQ